MDKEPAGRYKYLMKHPEQWVPTKVIRSNGHFGPSRDPSQLGIGSRIAAGKQINFYDDALRQHAAGKLLDMGCGKVPYYEMYRDLVDEVMCIDWANSLHGNPFTDHEVDLNAPLPLSDKSFDTILLTDVLEHIEKPLELMLEVARILAPRGVLIVGVPFFYWLHEQPHDYYRYTQFALKAMATRNRLEVVSIKPYGGAPEILCDILGKCIGGSGFKRTCSAFTSMAQIVLRMRLAKKVSDRTSDRFPLGYVMVARKPA